MAIDAYEAAQAFDPDDKSLRRDPRRSVRQRRQELPRQGGARAGADAPQEPVPRRELQALAPPLHRGQAADAAWCLCQALAVLNLAEPDEERFYKRHLPQDPAAAQAVLGEDDWGALTHADVEPLLTRIFAIIQPVIIHARTQSLEAAGLDRRYAIDLPSTRTPSPRRSTTRQACSACSRRSSSEPERPRWARLPPHPRAVDRPGTGGVRPELRHAGHGVRRGTAPDVLPPRVLRATPRADRDRAESVALRRHQAQRAAVPHRAGARGAGPGGDPRDEHGASRGRARASGEPGVEAPAGGHDARPEEVGGVDRSHGGPRGDAARAQPRDRDRRDARTGGCARAWPRRTG